MNLPIHGFSCIISPNVNMATPPNGVPIFWVISCNLRSSWYNISALTIETSSIIIILRFFNAAIFHPSICHLMNSGYCQMQNPLMHVMFGLQYLMMLCLWMQFWWHMDNQHHHLLFGESSVSTVPGLWSKLTCLNLHLHVPSTEDIQEAYFPLFLTLPSLLPTLFQHWQLFLNSG